MKYILLILLMTGLSVSAQKKEQQIAVVYYNKVDQKLKDELFQAIADSYHCTVYEMSDIFTLPKSAYYAPRKRYRAEVLLKDLQLNTGTRDRILAVTTQDISTTHNGVYDWGIMGLAAQPGVAAVISTYRLRSPNTQLFYDRLIKVALHELGHTMGLPHCTYSKTCYMQDASGTIKTVDRETRTLCTHCKQLLNKLLD